MKPCRGSKFDPDDRGRTPPPDARAKCGRKERCKGMKSTKERIRVHIEIERENAEHYREWKEGGGAHDVGANEG